MRTAVFADLGIVVNASFLVHAFNFILGVWTEDLPALGNVVSALGGMSLSNGGGGCQLDVWLGLGRQNRFAYLALGKLREHLVYAVPFVHAFRPAVKVNTDFLPADHAAYVLMTEWTLWVCPILR